MNNLLLLCSFLLLMNGTIKKEFRSDNRHNTSSLSINDSFLNPAALVIRAENEKEAAPVRAKNEDLDLDSIVYIEDEDEVALGFDTAEYLPRGFNPHEAFFDIHSINYIEEEAEAETDFFFDIATLNYIEDEDEVALGFDTAEYLPRGFNPYETFFDIHSINYIEDEDNVTLGFDTATYLPRGFNPYEAFFDIHSVNYIEEKEEIKLGFDTKKYLPKGFNAHAKPAML